MPALSLLHLWDKLALMLIRKKFAYELHCCSGKEIEFAKEYGDKRYTWELRWLKSQRKDDYVIEGLFSDHLLAESCFKFITQKEVPAWNMEP
jgi:hypothetical protein